MTSTDTLLPCPFCGGEARISRAHQNKMLAMGEVPTDEHYLFTLYHDCANGITICWTYKPKDALIAAWNHRTPPTPAAEEREAVAQWCSGCHEVRSVDCYRADCPKSDTERRAAETLAAEREREAFAERVFRHGFSDGWTANQKGRLAASASVDEAWHFYVADGALQKSVALTANHSPQDQEQ